MPEKAIAPPITTPSATGSKPPVAAQLTSVAPGKVAKKRAFCK